tara:strand:- start:1115 stop:1309 length:195 start_codon:yes stop_codon:yes gene_type:complete
MSNMIKTLKETLRRRRNINATVAELHRLSDAELKDIGIPRGNIEQVARGIVDIHRTVRDSKKGE